MSSTETRVAGSWWFWVYRTSRRTGEQAPAVSLPGRRGWFGRDQLTSERMRDGRVHVLCFFTRVDKVLAEFLRALQAGVKSAVVLGTNEARIHVIVVCESLERFDEDIKQFVAWPVYADVGGRVTDEFGLKPVAEVVNVASIFGGADRAEYKPQFVSGMYAVVDGVIVKSPAYQPKMQACSVSTIKGVFELATSCKHVPSDMMKADSFAADIPEDQLRVQMPDCWKAFVTEKAQMDRVMAGGSAAASSSSSAAARASSSASPAAAGAGAGAGAPPRSARGRGPAAADAPPAPTPAPAPARVRAGTPTGRSPTPRRAATATPARTRAGREPDTHRGGAAAAPRSGVEDAGAPAGAPAAQPAPEAGEQAAPARSARAGRSDRPSALARRAAQRAGRAPGASPGAPRARL